MGPSEKVEIHYKLRLQMKGGHQHEENWIGPARYHRRLSSSIESWSHHPIGCHRSDRACQLPLLEKEPLDVRKSILDDSSNYKCHQLDLKYRCIHWHRRGNRNLLRVSQVEQPQRKPERHVQ